MSILGYNGGAVLAMRGFDCVGIATDHRFGIQGMTISLDMPKVFEIGPHLYLGLPGLSTDMQTVKERLIFRKNIYELSENRTMSPKTFSHITSNLLYEHRFGPYFVEPIIAGLKDGVEPFICNMDFIGCRNVAEDFVVGGTCSEQMYGMCEAIYEPDMHPDELFECISQVLMNAADRDAGSGWGATIHVIEKDKVTQRKLKTRMD
ncbi:proteasome subunit beta type-3-like [Ctenocephalides felis]|uniref:proteasome subunit beta type-3-like n=1 Tax=Ctenocephalides felis TaxID=7515 RepID=UPI000E6E3CEF|nr:proteasome subunit beta type-3-like [Ctenocephalides felis]